ncbi:hypothetical protein SAMN04488030_0283 [Aliiroseovarius halocynthiae]|uniref:YbjN domain-containing protein n=2 Tax=Aliiroseovarius halocynthiae TaxID=985055 RepID=A0A545SYP9_9RHOB|nr:hypothetical protein [Aliiroseovarius halocynthiae]TQV70059.1 hypothetical protein FIL88_01125 [Aliiroseovarius halocynthiae]SMR70671.1 hypothetical protein SAMN04488030_0283 [Aliiroseovarius halocynthiae]
MRFANFLVLAVCLAIVSPMQLSAQVQSEPPMTYERIGRILAAIDPDLQPQGNGFQMVIGGVPMIVITDPAADRMRAMVRIGPAGAMDDALMQRMLQANFDAVLDARYAVAGGQIWSTFIHPLSPLETRQLVSALTQTVVAAQSFGTAFTGGGVQFGGGDSNALQQELIDQLQKKGIPL